MRDRSAKPPKHPHGPVLAPLAFGPSIPSPLAEERNTDTTWAAWSDLNARQDAEFAPTEIAPMPVRMARGDPRYADTLPASLLPAEVHKQPAATPAAPRRRATLEQVLAEARRHNRVCPQPPQWVRFYEMLPGKKHGAAGWEPPLPPTGRAWRATPALAKRMVLRDHIEWAAAHGALEQALRFLQQLPEAQWVHLGD